MERAHFSNEHKTNYGVHTLVAAVIYRSVVISEFKSRESAYTNTNYHIRFERYNNILFIDKICRTLSNTYEFDHVKS